MSISNGKVRLYIRRRKNAVIIGALVAVQFLLTMILAVSLAANIIWPEQAKSATPAPMQISYEGRLTDSSGNALGGTGSQYCYRFSMYDSPTGGKKLWPPQATPSATTATTTDGVFSAVIGQADTLSSSVFDFSTTSTVYLQVDVGTTSPTCASGLVESLSPRQQINSSGYALSANNLGSYADADYTNGRVQIGSGAGGATPIYFRLDVKNTADQQDYVGSSCSPDGLMWYNSNAAITQALVCVAGHTQAVGNDATTTVEAITATGGGTLATSGTVSFANANNVSFGIAGNTITATVAAGGGATFSNFQWPPGQASSFNANMVNGGVSIGQLNLPQTLVATRAMILANCSVTTSTPAGTLSISIGLYTLNGSTLSSVSSGSQTFTYSSGAVSLVNGIRRISVPMTVSATPGDYWYAVRLSSAGGGSYTVYGGARSSGSFSGNLGVATATSRQMIIGVGSVTSSAMVSSVAATALQGNAAAAQRMPWILFSNVDIN